MRAKGLVLPLDFLGGRSGGGEREVVRLQIGGGCDLRDPAVSTSTERPESAKIRLTSGSEKNAFFSEPTTPRTVFTLLGMLAYAPIGEAQPTRLPLFLVSSCQAPSQPFPPRAPLRVLLQ